MSTSGGPSPRPIAVAFAVSALAAVGFAVSFTFDLGPQAQGGTLALAFGGLGFGLIRWARSFTKQGPFIEDRRPPSGDPEDQEALLADLDREGGAMLRRRAVGKYLAAALGAFGLAALAPIRWIARRPIDDLRETAWDAGSRLVREDGSPVHVDDLEPGGVLTVFPEGHTDAADSQTILIRLEQAALRRRADRADWSPQGFIAYSRLCTHAGCPVGLYEEDSNLLYCPCHQSVFDAADEARPLMGPATRRLPQLPLAIDDEGYVRAQRDFDDPVGPGYWEMP